MEKIKFAKAHEGVEVRCIMHGKVGAITKATLTGPQPVVVTFEDGTVGRYQSDGSAFAEGERVLLIGHEATLSVIEAKLPEPAVLCPFCGVAHETAGIRSGRWTFTTPEGCPLYYAYFESKKVAELTMVKLSESVDVLRAY